MEAILTAKEAEQILHHLTDKTKEEIKRDKIRFGEFFVGKKDDAYFRVDPINVIVINGKARVVLPDSITEI